MSDSLRHVGDVNIEFVEISSGKGKVQDITKQVVGISVYEDIMSPFITGNVVIKDSQDLMNFLPLVGEEIIRFTITTPTFTDKKYSIGGSFSLYKLSEREESSDKSVVYILHFASIESIIDLNKKISATIDGSCSDIATKILKTNFGFETQKPVNVEQTPNGTKFISNFWSPSKCLNYTATNSANANGSPSYLFFENRYGFNFVSVESLFSNQVFQTFISDNYANSEANTNPEEMYKRIIDFSIPVVFDYMDSLASGVYTSKLFTYDVITKKYTARNYNILNDFKNQKHLNTYPIVSNNIVAKPSGALAYDYKMYNNFNNYGDVTNTATKQKRISFLENLSSSRINITVPGRTDYTVGQKIYLKMYKKSQANDYEVQSSEEDKILSGYYLISSIHHVISRENHTCYMEIMRDSINVDLNS